MSDKVTMRDLIKEAKEAGRHEPVKEPGDEYYTPPVVSVSLPSCGKVYPPDSTLFDVQSLDVRAMCASDEDIMTSPALLRKGRMLSALMKACTVSRTIDADKMLIGDRNALMVAIRNSSYGPDYTASVGCPHCGTEYENTFNLSRLVLKKLEVEPIGLGQNLFEFRLPVSNRRVVFRLFTADLAKELEDILEAQKKAKGPGAREENVTMGLIHQIVEIEGISDKAAMAKFIRSMPVRDSRALRTYIDKISPEVDMTQEAECPSCGKRADVEVPLTSEFFWPKA